jgi:hypothetical protein
MHRRLSAKEGPPDYANTETGDVSGDPTLPANELIRIQTRTGHQIVMHNTEDLIYIAHGSGDSWIEMTANGKIDIYSKDSISVRSETDINFTADRDINFTALENINMVAEKNIKLHSVETTTQQAKNYKMHVEEESNIRIEKDSFVYVNGAQHLFVEGNKLTTVRSNMETKVDLKSILEANSISEKAADDHTLGSNQVWIDNKVQINGTLDVKNLTTQSVNGTDAGSSWADLAPGDNQILGNHSFSWRGTAPLSSTEADEAVEFEDEDFAFYVKRTPEHEPWADHEHIKPVDLTPDLTIADNKEPAENVEAPPFPPINDTFKKSG